MKATPPLLTACSRRMRRDATDAEALVWSRLRGRQLAGAKFRRQQPLGPFIVDFCCMEQRLIIELDGGQHAERCHFDRRRNAALRTQRFRVLRFWDNEVRSQLDAVLEVVWRELNQAS